MARKAKNHSIDEVKSEKKVSNIKSSKPVFLGEYFNVHTFQKHPLTHNFFIREAQNLKIWADLEDSFRISDFYDKQGYQPALFYRWVNKYEELEIAYNYALRRIGSRRESGAMHRQLAGSTVHRTLGHYDPIWKEETRILNEARSSLAQQNESRVVVIERFPSPSDGKDKEVISIQSSPEEIAGNIHRNTSTQREVRVGSRNTKIYKDS